SGCSRRRTSCSGSRCRTSSCSRSRSSSAPSPFRADAPTSSSARCTFCCSSPISCCFSRGKAQSGPGAMIELRPSDTDRSSISFMTTIKHQDLVQSVADALQYISYYHPKDYLEHLARAYQREQSPAAKDAIAQILTNSRLCAEGRRPICQDTGIVNVFLKIGMDVRFEGFEGSVADAVDEGVRRAYLDPDNKLRASVLADPQFARRNTKDNTPAVVTMELVPGNTV